MSSITGATSRRALLFFVATALASGCEPPTYCSDECRFAADGECDDGRAGAVTGLCAPGTDCTDCGPNPEAEHDAGVSGGRDGSTPMPDAGPADAGPSCTDLTHCAELRTMRDDTFCPDQLRFALGNECDETIFCGIALYADGRYEDFSENDVRANTEAMFVSWNSRGCRAPSGARWVVRCSAADDPSVCRQLASTGPYLLTCHDGRPGVEQCVHYTFDSRTDRDSFYAMCAGLTSRTRDAHDCPSGATGNGFCRHTASGRRSDTYTYGGTATELRDRCASTGGTWMER
jgi:hypothetical protein